MASTTTSPTTARDEAVARWEKADAELIEAQEAERSASKGSNAHTAARKTRLSAGARKANARRDIGQAELDLMLEGVEFEAWTEPAKARVSRSTLTPMSQSEIEEKLAKVRALMATDLPESVKHSCDVRIRDLLKKAEQRGYQVS